VNVSHGGGHVANFVEKYSVGRGRRGQGGKCGSMGPDEAE
jgi:hypothetical protein